MTNSEAEKIGVKINLSSVMSGAAAVGMVALVGLVLEMRNDVAVQSALIERLGADLRDATRDRYTSLEASKDWRRQEGTNDVTAQRLDRLSIRLLALESRLPPRKERINPLAIP